jgi:predicted kinase
MLRTADTVADMHEAAPVAHRLTGVDAIRDVVKSNEMALFARAPRRFRPAEVAEWSKAAEQALDSVGSLLNLRAQQGKIRRCHGDLHLRNIYLDGGTPRLFDAIEFSEAINTIDALYDLSFLLMDLDHRGEHALANLVLNRYLGITGDFAGVPAMPLFLSTRAALRAHISDAVEAAETTSQERKSDEPERYLALARRYLSQSKPALIAIGGHSGSGKSSIARAIAPHIGQLPGAIHLQSDITRKRLFQVRPEVRLGSHAYSEATSAKVYALLREYASHALKAGFSVVVDATFLAAGERQAIEAVALETDTPFIGLWLDAPRAILEERIRRRVADPSDADVEVLASQLGAELPKDGWFAIYAGDSADATAARALGHLSREGVSGLRVSHGMHADPDI